MSAAGGMIMAASQELILTFLGLEILSIAVYVLAALHLRRSQSQEAAFKYFILGAVASALFLYGIALIYGATGSTSLNVIAGARGPNAAGLNPMEDSSMILAGMALMLIGFAFKISAVPFHMWTPDVYEGSPTPVVAFMASAVKVAGFAGLARVFWDGLGFYDADWRPIISILAIASLVVGSFLALAQTNVKRMLAYSSITHAGFMLVAFESLAGGAEGDPGTPEGLSRSFGGAEALLFYMLAYSIMVIGSFGVMTVAGRRGDGAHSLDDYRGLAKSQPLLAGLMAVMLFAQAGVPFTSGFLAKFRVIIAAANSGSYVLAGIAMLAAVVAAVLYLRVVVTMFMADGLVAHAMTAEMEEAVGDQLGDDEADLEVADESEVEPRFAVPKVALVAIIAAAVATIVLGTLPWVGEGVLRDAAVDLVLLR
jgi:NADH-quinone oxidoreductase subunit N